MGISSSPLWMCCSSSDKEAPHLKPSNQLLARTDTEQVINSKKELNGQSSRVRKCKTAAGLEPPSRWRSENRRGASGDGFLSEGSLTWASRGWTGPAGLLDRRAGTRSGPVCCRLSGTRWHCPAEPHDRLTRLVLGSEHYECWLVWWQQVNFNHHPVALQYYT